MYIIITAAGLGKRMGFSYPKQFHEINGQAILQYTIENAQEYCPEAKLIVVLPEQELEFWKLYCYKRGYASDYDLVSGGQERYFSVKNALSLLKDETGLVAIQDGVRPSVDKRIWQEGFALAAEKKSAIPVLDMRDSMFYAEENKVMPVNRSGYKRVQAPQFFDLPLLYQAYFQAEYQASFTDDASVFYAAGHALHIFEGDEENIKFTIPQDLE
jgi:2-C-methyl-D-erythritol 4-phosphate cytidylyltransferase